MSRCLTPEQIAELVSAPASHIQKEWRKHVQNCNVCRQAVADEELFRTIQRAVGKQGDATARPTAAPRDPAHPLDSPAAIPGYRLLSEIHRGSQGVVYRAIHSATQQPVALKILVARRRDNEQERRRFEREIDIVGTLEHPNIAKLYDSGSVSEMRFFAMELVEGESVDQWLRRHSSLAILPRSPAMLRETLRLFHQICDGVAHAHRKGIVHRDLKPENILLDEEQVPHIIDFGLAKPIDHSPTGAGGVQTQSGEFLGTIAYASPEQVSGNIGQVDVRSDVYSLGVLLYELLTYRLPYDVGGSLLDVLQRIREAEPIRPSAVRRDIDHELETIVLKALAKSPERRYETAGALAADLRRYLAGDPIEAKSPTVWYVTRKLVRRHRWLAATVTAFILVVCAGLVTSIALWQQAAAERDSARLAQRTASIARKNETRLRRQAEGASARAEFQAFVANLAAGELALRQYDVVDARDRLERIPVSLRRWEWYHLANRLDTSVARFHGHSSYVEDVACYHHRPLAVSVSWNNSVCVWDLRTRETIRTIPLDAHAWSVAVSPEDRWIAIGDWDGTLHVIDATTFDTARQVRHPGARVASVGFAPDGSAVAGSFVFVSATSLESLVQLVDCTTGNTVSQWTQPSYVHTISFDPLGNRLAIATSDNVEIRQLPGGDVVQSLPGKQTAAFASAGTQLAYATERDSVVIYSLEHDRQLVELKGHTGDIHHIVFASGDSRVVTASRDKTVRIWDASTGEPLTTCLGHTWTVTSLAATPDGRQVVSASWDSSCRIWSLEETPARFRRIQAHKKPILTVAVSPDGTKLASGSEGATAKIWDLATGRLLRTLSGHAGPIQEVAFSPNGQLIATASWDHTIRLWKIDDSGPPRVLAGHTDRVHAVAFSPDGKLLYSGSADNRLIVWDVASAKLLRQSVEHDDHIHRVVIGRAGMLLASAGHRSVRIWDAPSLEPRSTLPRQIVENDFTLAVDPSDSWLAAGSYGHQIVLWRLEDLRPAWRLQGHTDETLSLDWNPEGDRLVSCSLDGTVRVWDPHHATLLIKLDSKRQLVQSIAFSPDGTSIVGGTDRGDVLIWSRGNLTQGNGSEHKHTSQPAVAGAKS